MKIELKIIPKKIKVYMMKYYYCDIVNANFIYGKRIERCGVYQISKIISDQIEKELS